MQGTRFKPLHADACGQPRPAHRAHGHAGPVLSVGCCGAGSASASWQRSGIATLTDYVVMLVAMLGLSLPTFWLDLMILIRGQPPMVARSQIVSIKESPLDTVRYLIMPALPSGSAKPLSSLADAR